MEIARNLVDAARNLTTSSPDPDRAFRLRLDEPVPDGIRRIARGQLRDAHDELEGTPARRLGEAVHATRKRFKRLRATVRLARDAIGEQTYEHENTALRMAGRRIAGPRDAEVLLETLDALTERFADELPSRATAALRDRLERDRQIATSALTGEHGDIDATRAAIAEALVRTPAWTFERDGFDAIRPGLKRIYRRGRRAMRAAREDPTPEKLHEWRKRVKDLWHATEIVCDARPEQLERVARRAHKLSSRLGDITTSTCCAPTSPRTRSASRTRTPGGRCWRSSTGARRAWRSRRSLAVASSTTVSPSASWPRSSAAGASGSRGSRPAGRSTARSQRPR
jgi:CHAD domain-containing protein